MAEEPITFEFIRKIQREEKSKTKLSEIPEDFYQKAKIYLNQKKKMAPKQKDKISKFELKNIQRLLEDIYNRRETKMVNQAILTTRTEIIPENLIKQEEEFFESIVHILRSQRERVLNTLLKKSKEELEKVKFVKKVDEFVGVNLKKYGPYKKGDKAKIPKENAKLLINVGKAKKVK